MSIRVMSKVWENSQQKGTALLLLLAIADYANDDGEAWPAIETLAKKIRMSERYTHLLVTSLIQAGELSVKIQAGKKGCNLFTVGGEARLTLKPASPGGEARLPKGVRPVSPEPSENHQETLIATSAAEEFFRQFGRKRWKSPAEKELFETTETEVGYEHMLAAVKWGATNGIAKVPSICSAARKWGTNGHQSNKANSGPRLPDGV
jgi:hypothetical protein